MSLRDPKTQRMLITVAVCGLSLWAYFLSDLLPFGYAVQSRKAKELRAAQETVETELEKARRTVGNLPQLEREQRELERKWRQAETLLPTDREIATLLTQITQAGEQAGVTFQTFKPGPPRPQEFYNENPVDIEVRGGFHQVGVFLSRVANLPRIVNVTGLSLEGTKQKSRAKSGRGEKSAKDDDIERTDHTLVASFTATAYSLRDPVPATPQAPPAERGENGRRAVQAASVGSSGTPGAVVKRVGAKAKSNAKAKAAVEGEQ